MSMTDPIADLLTRIRNAQSAHKEWVDIPCSNLKKRIAFVLKEEKFIRDMLLIKDNKSQESVFSIILLTINNIKPRYFLFIMLFELCLFKYVLILSDNLNYLL